MHSRADRGADENRVVEQTVYMPVIQRVERNIEVMKITQQVENTQFQLQIDSRQNPAATRRTSCERMCQASFEPRGGESAQTSFW